MTDKQIIIDGIDVSGCEHLYREIDCLAHIDFTECCEGYDPSYGYCPNIDCYYKQLKRKEQECEELKAELELFKTSNQTTIDQLKAENEELKEQLEIAKQNYSYESEKREIYIQTLTEIKKLVEKEFCRHIECCEFCANSNDCLNQKIIEKINEVEDAHTL